MKCVAVVSTLMLSGFLLGEFLSGDGPFSVGLSPQEIWFVAAAIPGVWLFYFAIKKWFEWVDSWDRD
jgi:hypothetical protein